MIRTLSTRKLTKFARLMSRFHSGACSAPSRSAGRPMYMPPMVYDHPPYECVTPLPRYNSLTMMAVIPRLSDAAHGKTHILYMMTQDNTIIL